MTLALAAGVTAVGTTSASATTGDHRDGRASHLVSRRIKKSPSPSTSNAPASPSPTTSATAGTGPATSPSPTIGATASTSPTTSATSAGSGWTKIVDDEFNAPGVPSHWSLYNGPYGSGAHNCAVPSHATVPGDGYLHMKMGWESSGKCGAGWYTAGMQISHDLGAVDQRITVRWRVTGTDLTNVRSHRIIPMRWTDDPNFQWYQGESDFCEGSGLTGCSTYLHHSDSSSQVSRDYTVDLTQWHTMRFEQSNHVVKAYIDDMVNPVWTYNGTATTVPDAFRRAVLQQECRSSCPSSSFAGQTEDIQIDWIQIENAG